MKEVAASLQPISNLQRTFQSGNSKATLHNVEVGYAGEKRLKPRNTEQLNEDNPLTMWTLSTDHPDLANEATGTTSEEVLTITVEDSLTLSLLKCANIYIPFKVLHVTLCIGQHHVTSLQMM